METLWYRPGNLLTGLAVQRFQEFGEQVIGDVQWLETHGTKAGNDGFFGRDSDTLARLVQTKLGIYVDGVVGPGTWSEIFGYLKVAGPPTTPKIYTTPSGVKVIDGRGIWTPVKKYSGTQRTWTDTSDRNCIQGVMFHQTGCWMPEDPEVWKGINAHIGITRAGTLILMFPFEYLIWHGNDLTRPTIGIEIAGLFHGVEGDSRSYWPRGATTHVFNEAQKKALEVLFGILLKEFEKRGALWRLVVAHRESHDWRMGDPGSAIWQIAMEWIKQLIARGMPATDGGRDFCVGSGKPIPEEWNPAYKGNKFWS